MSFKDFNGILLVMKGFLKSTLFLFLVNVIVLAMSIAGGGLIYMVYCLCSNSIAGENIKLFNDVLFIKGMLVFTPFSLCISGIFLVFYIIRHKMHSGAIVAVYGILYAVSWLVLMPLTIVLEKEFNRQLNSQNPVECLSSGYFRTLSDDSVVYYSRANENGSYDGLKIQNGRAEFFSDCQIENNDEDFRDSLVKSDMAMGKVVSFFTEAYKKLCMHGKRAAGKNYLWWMTFSSLGLALLGCVCLRQVSSWRILNVSLVLVFYAGILYFNFLCYEGKLFVEAQTLFAKAVNGFPGNMFVFLCNVLVFAFLVVFGIVVYIHNKNKAVPFNSYTDDF